MGIDDRVIRAMEPGIRYSVANLSAAMACDYSMALFALERLVGFGFVEVDFEELYKLTPIGERLNRILSSPRSPRRSDDDSRRAS